jgi:hypothetical protein
VAKTNPETQQYAAKTGRITGIARPICDIPLYLLENIAFARFLLNRNRLRADENGVRVAKKSKAARIARSRSPAGQDLVMMVTCLRRSERVE